VCARADADPQKTRERKTQIDDKKETAKGARSTAVTCR
jgi:hypothetical protein